MVSCRGKIAQLLSCPQFTPRLSPFVRDIRYIIKDSAPSFLINKKNKQGDSQVHLIGYLTANYERACISF